MTEDFIEVNGKDVGPTSVVLVGTHGNEKSGVEALPKALSNLTLEKGRVLFGYGNPRAIEENKRFLGANLNRMFMKDDFLTDSDKKSYEYGRAQFLKKYLNQAEALLDVHASSTPESKPFIICEENAKEIVRYLPVDLIVSGFDKIEPGGTDYYMNSVGKIGICIECGYIGDTKSVEVAEDAIFAFLKTRGHIENNLNIKEQSRVNMDYLYKTKTNNFVLKQPFKDFEEIKFGQVIGMDGGQEIVAEKDCVILFARNRTKIGEEAFLLGEKKDGFM